LGRQLRIAKAPHGINLRRHLGRLCAGAVSSAALLVGTVAGLFSRLSHHAIATAMSVVAGLLLAAVSLKLATDAVRMAGPVPASAALLLGAAIFSAVNVLLAEFRAAHRKRCGALR
jgi:zinc transporter, ZIP family